LHTRLLDSAAAIVARSGGQLRLVVHANGELDGQVGLLAQLGAGTIDAVPLTSQLLSA
jgi:TRAP-type C4-dicarboxylate transport system substrate-binding protein